MGPKEEDMKKVDPEVLIRQDEVPRPESRPRTFATALEESWIVTVLLVAMGVAYEVRAISQGRFEFDINAFIFNVFLLGLLLHWRPIRYIRSFDTGARTVGPILLPFPLYGGIMGIMGFCVIALIVGLVLYGGSLLIFA
jgi:short-chain fatty acids transporter